MCALQVTLAELQQKQQQHFINMTEEEKNSLDLTQNLHLLGDPPRWPGSSETEFSAWSRWRIHRQERLSAVSFLQITP